MIRLIWAMSIKVRSITRRFTPTNIVADKVQTRSGLKWGTAAMLLAIPYLFIAVICRQIIQDGGPGWLHLVVLLCLWNSMKMLWLGPVSLIQLARIRHQESAARRTGAPENYRIAPSPAGVAP